MRDVARLAGVSISTVSAVLNGTAVVSEERTERVRRAIEALSFAPDHIARSLKTGRTNTIGVVIPDITNAFYPAVLRGIEDAAREARYTVLFCNSNEDPAEEQSLLKVLVSRRVDGILLACSGDTIGPVLSRRHCPIVFVDRVPIGIKEGAVTTDNYEAAELATRHLLDLGHRRIALLGGRLQISPHLGRLQGFLRTMNAAGLPVLPEYIHECDMQIESGYAGGKKLLSLQPRPTAILASNNKLLLGSLRSVQEMNLKCPSQLSLIGFDDHAWNEHLNPRLTTVIQPAYEMGTCAFRTLFRRMRPDLDRPEDGNSGMTFLKARLEIRESTGPVPAAL
jgi:LacI family transcriptional regulator, galactose operon repressor